MHEDDSPQRCYVKKQTCMTAPSSAIPVLFVPHRARKSRTTLQNKVRLKVLPEQLTLFVNTSVTFKKCIIK